jgi:peptidylprolyl isomerase
VSFLREEYYGVKTAPSTISPCMSSHHLSLHNNHTVYLCYQSRITEITMTSRLSIALLAICNILCVGAWTVTRDIPRQFAPINRREALIGGTAVLGGVTLFSKEAAAGSDLTAFQDGTRGIKYLILKEGDGDKPARGQKVDMKYTLWTGGFGKDGGTKVDSNTGPLGRPFSTLVGVGQVIKGWDLTLLDMKLGEVRRIVVPSDLGYGDKGAGGAIPPKATLYFELEITGIDEMKEFNDTQRKWLEDNPL